MYWVTVDLLVSSVLITIHLEIFSVHFWTVFSLFLCVNSNVFCFVDSRISLIHFMFAFIQILLNLQNVFYNILTLSLLYKDFSFSISLWVFHFFIKFSALLLTTQFPVIVDCLHVVVWNLLEVNHSGFAIPLIVDWPLLLQ